MRAAYRLVLNWLLGNISFISRALAAMRWRRLLASCDLSLESASAPLRAPGDNDFIIAGCPRTGTSLLAASLFQPPDVVVSMEPWDGLRMLPSELFDSLRSEVEDSGALRRGRLDVEAIRSENRVSWVKDDETSVSVEANPGFLLGVKWPTFWQYLDFLPTTKFLVTLRHPVEVIASFQKTGGRLAEGFDYDVAFNARMNNWLARASDDPRERSALMYQYIYSRVAGHLKRENVLMVRYEDWFNEPALLTDRIAEFLGLDAFVPAVDITTPRRDYRDEYRVLARRHCQIAGELGYDL